MNYEEESRSGPAKETSNTCRYQNEKKESRIKIQIFIVFFRSQVQNNYICIWLEQLGGHLFISQKWTDVNENRMFKTNNTVVRGCIKVDGLKQNQEIYL